jgi:hypothetical protein
MATSQTHSRLFTVHEANDLLPTLRVLMERTFRALDALKQKSETVIQDQRLLASSPGLMGRLQQNDTIARLIQEVRGLAEEIQSFGCVCKGVEQGLVDFPCLLGGEIVYLCWRYGEESVGHWHRVEEGYAGRRPLLDPDEVGGGSVSFH